MLRLLQFLTMARPQKYQLKNDTKRRNYYIDVAEPVSDNIVNLDELKYYFQSNMKIGPRSTKEHGDMLEISSNANTKRIHFKARVQMRKRYVKYLAKKYFKRAHLRDYIRIVADSKMGFKCKYIEVGQDA